MSSEKSDLIAEYLAAYRSANAMSDPPDITYAAGWFTFKNPGTYPRKYRQHRIEEMKTRLIHMAAEKSEI